MPGTGGRAQVVTRAQNGAFSLADLARLSFDHRSHLVWGAVTRGWSRADRLSDGGAATSFVDFGRP